MQVPLEYDIVLEDRTTMSDKLFYIPGLESADKAQWNKITPAFRILARRDCAPFSEYGLQVSHMNPPSWAMSFHEQNAIKMRELAMTAAMTGNSGGLRGF